MIWPCGTGKKLVRAHARGAKLGLGLRLRMLGFGGSLW